MKAFAYVNPTTEKDAVAALQSGGIVPPAGGRPGFAGAYQGLP